jgi:hypothetical protein
LLIAVHPHPVATVTLTLPVTEPDPTERAVGDIEGVQVGENEKPFETALAVDPPGPTALTRASNVRPGVSVTCSSGRKSTRMTPFDGVGLPRSIVSTATDDPAVYTDSEYR